MWLSPYASPTKLGAHCGKATPLRRFDGSTEIVSTAMHQRRLALSYDFYPFTPLIPKSNKSKQRWKGDRFYLPFPDLTAISRTSPSQEDSFFWSGNVRIDWTYILVFKPGLQEMVTIQVRVHHYQVYRGTSNQTGYTKCGFIRHLLWLQCLSSPTLTRHQLGR